MLSSVTDFLDEYFEYAIPVISAFAGFCGGYWIFVRNWVLDSLKDDLKIEQVRLNDIRNVCYKQINELLLMKSDQMNVDGAWDVVQKYSVELDDVSNCSVTEIATLSWLARHTMENWKPASIRLGEFIPPEILIQRYLSFVEKIRHYCLMPIRIPSAFELIAESRISDSTPKTLLKTTIKSRLAREAMFPRGAIFDFRRLDLIEFSTSIFVSGSSSLSLAYFQTIQSHSILVSQMMLFLEIYMPISIPTPFSGADEMHLIGLQKLKTISLSDDIVVYRATYAQIKIPVNIDYVHSFDESVSLFDTALKCDSGIRPVSTGQKRVSNILKIELNVADVERGFKKHKSKIVKFVKRCLKEND